MATNIVLDPIYFHCVDKNITSPVLNIIQNIYIFVFCRSHTGMERCDGETQLSFFCELSFRRNQQIITQ